MRLRKLYIDCVADDGSVCIAYASCLQGFGLQIAPAGIERYDAQGEREVHRARALLSLAQEPDAACIASLRFELAARSCVLEIEPEQGTAETANAAAMPAGLEWGVKLARGRVRIRDLRGAGDLICGTGYADWVELTRMPRALDLATLEWGRAHLERGTLVYTRVERSDGSVWQAATLWPRVRTARAIADFEITHAARDGARRIRFAGAGECAFDLELTPQRALHHGSALDRGRFPSWLERGISRAVAGPTREQRWLSQARCALLGRGVAVHESVCFGARALEVSA